ncbi:MAG: hypothetical protein IJE60_00420 [Tyzzerella sp.]|nr:hypothetical protein [Tyzzerella sp.]
MKKRVLAGIMMAAMMVASVMSVSAAGSKTEEVEVSKDNNAGYTVESKADTFNYLEDITNELPTTVTPQEKAELQASAKEAQTAIVEMNKNTDKIPESVIADIKEDKAKLENTTLICPVFDLEAYGTHAQCEIDGFHTLKLNVPALKNCDPKSVVVLHYSVTRGYWEVVKDVKVDGTTLSGKFYDLSPVAIYAKVTTGGAAGTSPSTVGTSSTWMLLAAVAVVALGAGVVATQKKSR